MDVAVWVVSTVTDMLEVAEGVSVVIGTPGMIPLEAGMAVVPTTGRVVVGKAAEGTTTEPTVDSAGTEATEPVETTTTVDLVSLCVG